MTPNPFPSFSILLPDGVAEEHEDTVASYWKKGDSCLLQVSSFRRDSGPQVSAAQRLSDRAKNGFPETGINVVDAMTAPVGEVAANLKYDKGFRDETAKYGAASAAVAGSAAAAPARN